MISFSINTKYSYITKCLKDYRIGEEAAKNIEDSLWKQFQALPVAFRGFFDNVTYIKNQYGQNLWLLFLYSWVSHILEESKNIVLCQE